MIWSQKDKGCDDTSNPLSDYETFHFIYLLILFPITEVENQSIKVFEIGIEI